MAQPIVKYTLNKRGQIPEWIDTSDASFAGLHGITGNKTGYIPKYESPQDMIFLGIASGDPDPDGTPDDYVGIITTKALLQAYICLLYTSPSPRDGQLSRMPSSA